MYQGSAILTCNQCVMGSIPIVSTYLQHSVSKQAVLPYPFKVVGMVQFHHGVPKLICFPYYKGYHLFV